MTANLPAHTITISGPDAIAFAHAQFSSRVSSLAIGQWQFSAWLDARGRVRAWFHLVRCADETLNLLLRGGDGETIAAALRRFVFRSRVEVMSARPRHLHSGPAAPLYAARCDPDLTVLGCGEHSLRVTPTPPGDTQWRIQQLRVGWPWLPDAALDRWLAPALSLQRLQAVVTDKGCYPGQEIVARLHFRGVHKQHLCNLILSREMQAGEQLRVAGLDAGCVLDVVAVDAHFEALAVLGDEAIKRLQASGRPGVYASNSGIQLQQVWPA